MTASDVLTEGRPRISDLTPRGPVSQIVLDRLATKPRAGAFERFAPEALPDSADPGRDDDFQLGLYLLHEIDYRSIEGIDDRWESDAGLFQFRVMLDDIFLEDLAAAVGAFSAVAPEETGDELFRLEREDDGPSLSRFLELSADLDQFREFMIHRSLYQLKEADPHTWAIPRLAGRAKAAIIEVQADEYGGGDLDRMHSRLFSEAMAEVGLLTAENRYLNRIPGSTLATVNLMSALGKRRARRGAIVGHLSMFEMSSAIPNRRYANGLRRLGQGSRATEFFDEHVEADSVHENIAAYDLAQGLAVAEPEISRDIQFGARALLHLEHRFAEPILKAWNQDRSSLLG